MCLSFWLQESRDKDRGAINATCIAKLSRGRAASTKKANDVARMAERAAWLNIFVGCIAVAATKYMHQKKFSQLHSDAGRANNVGYWR